MQKNKRWQILLLLPFLVSLIATAPPGSHPKADLILQHGRIYTMDTARSWAESVAISKGRIIYVGSDSGSKAWIGDQTKVTDLNGKFVLPGFIDSHIHVVSSGVGLGELYLADMDTKEKVLAAVKSYVESHPDLKVITGSRWPLPAFPDANPQKEWLDAIEPNRPVILSSSDGHSTWVNSKALQMAGITKDTKDPDAGRIERNAQGEPTGTLREKAARLINDLIPETTQEDRIAGLKRALALMNKNGITGFQDPRVAEETLRVYKLADDQGFLTARAACALRVFENGSLEDATKQVENFAKLRDQYRSRLVKAAAIKIYEDGVVEAQTAAMLHPYLNKGNDAGAVRWEPPILNPLVALADKDHFQVHFHAIGDRAVRFALDSIEFAKKQNGVWDNRPLFAHIQFIDPADIPRFVGLAAIPLFQPLWAYEDSYVRDLTLPVITPETARWMYPMQSVASTGAALAMGSDWSVSSLNPLLGIEVAVTRQDPNGPKPIGDPYHPEERIDLRTALAAYTIGSAYANFWEKETGSIEAGKSADIIVLSENPFAVPPAELSEIKVLLTLFEGRAVYTATP
jgi:predicted amidohydrolase YtcJ